MRNLIFFYLPYYILFLTKFIPILHRSIAAYKKIDFRVRPPYGNYLTMFQNEQAYFVRLAGAFDMSVSESQRTGSVEQFVREMDLADIEISVVPGRKNLSVDSDEMFSLTERYPGRFMIFPYIDPTDGTQALEEIDCCRDR